MQKILQIDWNDTCTCDDWVCHGTDFETCHCHTVGYLVKRTNKAITLSATMGEQSNCQHITIPKGCITKITELKIAQ